MKEINIRVGSGQLNIITEMVESKGSGKFEVNTN